MKKTLVTLAVACALSVSAAAQSLDEMMPDGDPGDPSCADIRGIAAMMRSGASEVLTEFQSDPELFVWYSMTGWACLPEPYEVGVRGEGILNGVTCIITDNSRDVSDAEIEAAGASFIRGVAKLQNCSILLGPIPKTHGNGTIGESLRYPLQQRSGRPNIALEYGYFRERRSPLFWHLRLYYAQSAPGE